MDDNGILKLEFFQDKKTKIKLTGLRARKRSLEIDDYHSLERKYLESENGPKIFVLHTIVSELKPKEFKHMESAPKSLLPQGFDYYAGGHLHKTLPAKLKESNDILAINNKNNIIYPGCIFPTDFRELEKIKFGGFCLVSGEIIGDKLDLKVNYNPIKVIDVENIFLDCTNKSVLEVQNKLRQELIDKDFQDKIVTVRIFGTLSLGKTYEIRSNEIIQMIKDKGAYEVLVNKNALTTVEYQTISVSVGESNEEIESSLIKEHVSNVKISNFTHAKMEKKIYQFLNTLGTERHIGTKVMSYNESLKNFFLSIFELEEPKERKK